ncbi:MAG TPA: hypothetical protein VF160_02955 [Candidatus Dormibacteraeota bacterium]
MQTPDRFVVCEVTAMSGRIYALASALALALTLSTGAVARADTGDGMGACHSDNTGSTNATVSTFFSSTGASVQWDQDQSPAGDTAPWAVAMTVTPSGFYAGFCLNGFNDQPPPSTPPSYWFKANTVAPITSGTGGSPRLVIEFLGSTATNPDDINLRPLAWTGDWQQEGADATASDWDSVGGTAPVACTHYEMTYAEALACHPGEIVQDVFFVTDSIWKITGGYTNWIDELSYGPACLTAPGSAYNKHNSGGCTSDTLPFPLTIV